ncbi:family 20 glycosylhydrolase [Amphiplicatus metriothermophilus]|uniref:beta-N-acetylhexosaminidase n=1 Tax=Amphiplicatus metriothermophilus TaxID=1519374 RepID=A0A239PP76_9PROT|nr:family 20 glycosylhydrolase [Amphiplicatus metriothermophilus]MBB5518734.1 hexosaminidase [Amphiplicatus metriothermophilus]SNT72109.1 hexosaminidase [Amphiplicatus metriothermophilus]
MIEAGRLAPLGALLFLVAAGCADAPGDGAAASDEPGAARVAVPVIPLPKSVEAGHGRFRLALDGAVQAEGGAEAARVARYFADLMARTSDARLRVGTGGALATGALVFRLDTDGPAQEGAYRIDMTPERTTVSAASPAGLFYGAVTFWQLAAAAPREAGALVLDAARIEDAPGFPWRGVMLDSARHYQSPDFIKRFIDWMALHKLNVFHWHLTDDQGWRIEIGKYPQLTEIGAWRVPAGAQGVDPETGAPRRYGGYYTQDEIREIVAYARARFVTIVPEIEMPGHASAAIAAYPQYGAAPEGALRATPSDWGIYPYAYNIEEETFGFLEDVLSETMALFPGPYIHVGGDEADPEQWAAAPGVAARMRALGLEGAHALQGYFTRRIDSFLQGQGRRLVGWDEILEGGTSRNAVVMSWRGIDGAVEAARQGRDAVLAPAPVLYFDNWQRADPDEPPGRGHVVSLRDVYMFDPYPHALDDAMRAHVQGVQANIWTEHIRTHERVEHMAFPRLAAVAENAWAPTAAKDWPGFLARLTRLLALYDRLGVGYAKSAFTPRITVEPGEDGAFRVRIDNQADYGEIRYALGGAEPGADSPLANGEIVLSGPSMLKAATFANGETLARAQMNVSADALLRRRSQQLATCTEKLVLNLEDDAPHEGPRAVFLIDVMNPCWRFEGVDLTGVTAIEARVGQVPFNYQIGDAVREIAFRPPRTPAGELEARLGGCEGEPVASLPLEEAATEPAVSVLRASWPTVSGVHDVCFQFTAESVDPLWAIDEIRFIRSDAKE